MEKNTGSMILYPIGVIHSPFKDSSEAPRQGRLEMAEAVLELYPEYVEGLEQIADVKHLIVLYWFDRGDRSMIKAHPHHSMKEKGVFATRSPHRPNPIALDLVDLVRVEGNRLLVKGIDAIDGSPLLDIKPYSPGLDDVTEFIPV